MKFNIKNNKKSPDGFRYRGLQGSRLETLTDAIFGFSITLLIISSEVPKTYVELQASMYSFIGFIFCTLLMMTIWNSHKIYFTRYGLQDTKTYVLNTVLVFVLLFYIYPLKYLFSHIGTAIYVNSKLSYGDTSQGIQLALQRLKDSNLNAEQWSDLMFRFSFGLFIIYLVFVLFHCNALKKKKILKLNHKEIYIVRTSVQEYSIFLCITAATILISLTLGNDGFIYWSLSFLLIPVALPIHQRFRRKRYKRIRKQLKERKKESKKTLMLKKGSGGSKPLNEDEENSNDCGDPQSN